MALQSSGAIKLSEIQTEFGGSNPISMSEYYRNGTYVPSNNTDVPISGTISMSDFYNGVAATVLTISTNATEYNILTQAVAAGFNNSVGGVIQVTINAGVTVNASTTHAMQTGALHASTTLTITNNGTITGYDGAAGTTQTTPGAAGGAGGTPGQAIEVNALSGASVTVTNASGATIQSGRGGPGGGGGPGKGGYRDDPEGEGESCYYYVTGSSGAAGAQAAFGAVGNAGAAGSHHVTYEAECGLSSAGSNPGAGGAGSAAAKAINYGSHSVTLNNSGTVNGATS